MTHRTAPEGHRVLVSAPFGADASSIVQILTQHGYDARSLSNAAAVAEALDDHVGVVLVTEEALHTHELTRLKQSLAGQPTWSDIPFLVLAARHAGPQRNRESLYMRLLPFIGNAVVVERPLSLASLLSGLTSAMRSRQKQFDMRDRLRELEASQLATAASEAELRRVSDALPVMISFLDRDLRYRFANRAFDKWVAIGSQEIVGKHVTELGTDNPLALSIASLKQALKGKEIRLQQSLPQLDGRRRDVEISLLPRRDADGQVDGVHVFVQDVTDRRETEERLEAHVAQRTAALTTEMSRRERAEDALRQSQKMEAVGQLTGGIAHDFNNMLTGVLGSLELIKRQSALGNYERLPRYLDTAFSSAERAASLTARLLAFSRRQSLDARAVNVGLLLASLQELLHRSIRENIVLEVVHAPDLPDAKVDANQLENAIINLVVNARDAMPDGGMLTVGTGAVDVEEGSSARPAELNRGRYVVVSVTDTGVGMEADVLSKIFDPFFTTKPIGQGTGLGLSMVYGFARQSGGQVHVKSQVGQGTTASIYLPIADAAYRAPDERITKPVPLGQGEHVLIVEDDPAVRALMSECLEELSYSVLEVEDASAAIVILQSEQPLALMVSDVGLPGMNGRQLAEVARKHRPELPVLFVTGYAANAAIRAGYLGTNMSMITKPFRFEELGNKVKDMLSKH